MKSEMELMDWKNIERGAENQMRDAIVSVRIAGILHAEAVKQIKKLGGKTNEEEEREAKAKLSKGKKKKKDNTW